MSLDTPLAFRRALPRFAGLLPGRLLGCLVHVIHTAKRCQQDQPSSHQYQSKAFHSPSLPRLNRFLRVRKSMELSIQELHAGTQFRDGWAPFRLSSKDA